MPGADSGHFHASEKYPEDGVHVVDQHLLEVQLALSTLGVSLTAVVPHFKDDNFLDLPILALALVAGEGLRLLVLVLGDPVGRQGCKGLENGRSLTSALLGQELALDALVDALQVRATQLLQLLRWDLTQLLGALAVRV